MELLNNLGINAKLLIAQIVNFLILLFVLYKFAYGPVLKLLDERTKKIERGLKDAEDAQKKLSEISGKEKEILIKAKKQAQEIVAKAEEIAIKNKEEIIASAKEQSEKIIADSNRKIESERTLMFQEIKKQAAELVVAATEKIIDEKMNYEKDKNLIEKALK
ncbi:MAG TPA: F0F1 ATP synthase subunit B [Candidatus Moranbacteria bacterium]|nr:F0F1 ATP synthase subunit B [Candidatus Moranbacteria bacterium]HRZ33433.1 F0F1 ATP synthase subunit B [Candidatus Moranbacteria bacterium]